MNLLPQKLYSKEEVRKLDETAIKDFAISGTTLMQRAGKFAFEVLQQSWPNARTLAIFCGVGNNGGDGYVIARIARENNYQVTVYQLGEPQKITGDALAVYMLAIQAGVEPIEWQDNISVVADVIVDALLGTGLSTKLTGLWLNAVRYINSGKIPVLAIDIPTGLDANTGILLGDAICSTVTATFIGHKKGMFTGKARDYCGEVFFSSLDAPIEIYATINHSVEEISIGDLKDKMSLRKASTHKGNYGHVLVIGGAPGMGGAVRMAAEAALRVGAGLVSVLTHPRHAAYITANRPELMCFGVDDNILDWLEQAVTKQAIIVLGPGLGLTPWSRNLFNAVIATKLPMVIDADGLNLLSQIGKNNSIADHNNYILTPHPGEAARLLQTTVANIENDRFQAIMALQEKFNSTVVLKGAGTLVTYQSKIGVCSAGNARMATAGMGDILAGMIGGLLAQGLSLEDAAALGVCAHAMAGDLVSEGGMCGIIATDLLAMLSGVLKTR